MKMKSICIVPCGKKKIWDEHPDIGPSEAKKVYVGPFSSKCQLYAETFYPGKWFILSAKYGFLAPNDVVLGQYNVTFNDKRTKPISPKELIRQAEKIGILDCEEVIVLGGKIYRQMAELVFNGKTLIIPLVECKGIGYMMGRLNQLMLKNNEHDQ